MSDVEKNRLTNALRTLKVFFQVKFIFVKGKLKSAVVDCYC